MDIYVYDGNLNCVGVVDDYASLIWASRYKEVGDCELYVAATQTNLDMLQIGRYLARRVGDIFDLARTPDDMVCRITKVELTTSAESGDYITVTGIDVKSLLDQRVIWSTTTAQGNAESFVRQLVTDALISPTENGRQALKPDQTALLSLATAAGFTEESTEQVSYANLGEKIREICARYGWGYRFKRSLTGFLFDLYKGTDRHETVVFSDDFDNLISTDYIIDATEITNVALVGGSGEGASRYLEPAGTATGTARYEVFVDARNVSNEIKYEDLVAAYPLVADGGYGSIVSDHGQYFYQMSRFDAQIYDANELARLQAKYPGGLVVESVSGDRYYRVTNVNIAALPSGSPSANDSVTLLYIAYAPRLVSLGYDAIAGSGVKETFDGEIDPLGGFKYFEDFYLGDLVLIKNKYGIRAVARIVEIDEVHDASGNRVMPKYEYIS